MSSYTRWPPGATSLLSALGLTLAMSVADARPALVHDTETVSVPEPYSRIEHACLRGNDMLAVTSRPDTANEWYAAWAFVHLQRQSNGQWNLIGEIASASYDINADWWTPDDFACEGSLAAFSGPSGFAFVFEYTAAGWQAQQVPLEASWLYPSAVNIHQDTVAFSGKWVAPATIALVRKDAAGAWTDIEYVSGHPGEVLDPEDMGPRYLAFTGTQAIAAANSYWPPQGSDIVTDTQLFDYVNGTWQLTTLPLPDALYVPVEIGNEIALFGRSWTQPGEIAALYTRDAAGDWTVKHSMLSDESFLPSNIQVRGDRAYAAIGGPAEIPRIAVFRREAERRYRHFATLIPTERSLSSWGGAPRYTFDGSRIVVSRVPDGAAHIFTMPSTLPAPQRLEETFEDNSAAEWMPWGTTDWRIVTSDGSRVYRQHNTAGDARAIFEGFSGADQSIQADVRVRSLGTSSWVGFMLRYTSPQNFYYLLVNGTSVQIRRMHNGVFGPLATAPFTLALNRTYRFRIEAIGTRIRVFANGALVTEVVDNTHAQGSVGLTMWRASADFDNVVVTTSHQTTLLADSFSQGWPERERLWSRTIANAWSYVTSGEATYYRQSLLTDRPMAFNGGATGDQIVSAEVRPRAFNTSGNGIAGLVARYVNANNHYFAVITNRNTVSLRKRVNGATTILDDAPLTVTANSVYRMRLEAIGSSLRLYVNDRLVLEAQDTALPSGRYGMMTYHARADFDTFSAIRP